MVLSSSRLAIGKQLRCGELPLWVHLRQSQVLGNIPHEPIETLNSFCRVPPASTEQPRIAKKGFRPALKEYKDKCQELRSKHLGGRKYWYLNIVGRDPGTTEPGKL